MTPNIKINVDLDNSLTTFTVFGFLSVVDIIDVATKYYKGSPTKLALWDWTLCMTNNVTTDEVRLIVKKVGEVAAFRKDGKTALVDPADHHFGILRMFESYAITEMPSTKYFVARNLIDAKHWLFS